MRLDDALLEEFIQGFYGYGNLSAPCWFIGMEEGGGNSVEDITRRLEAWKQRGKSEVEDLVEYHHAIGETRFFDDPPKLQTTWKQLIRIYFSLRNTPLDDQKLRLFQRSHFARKNGETCLLELLPLPSPSVSGWLYGEHSSIPYLRSRKAYTTRIVPARIAHLQASIARHRPKLVLFYGMTYRQMWEQIAATSFTAMADLSPNTLLGKREGTTFVISQHPSAHGVSNQYFEMIGRSLRERRSTN